MLNLSGLVVRITVAASGLKLHQETRSLPDTLGLCGFVCSVSVPLAFLQCLQR